MIYKLIDTPIFRSQVDRRSLRQKRLDTERQERKRQQMEELFTVEQLVKMGFYNSKEKPKPHGVDVRWYRRQEIDQDGYQFHTVYVLRINLSTPQHQTEKGINKLCPYWSEEFQCYTWKYGVYGNASLWISLDLLSRIIQLSCWDEVEEIPLHWNAGNDKATEFAAKQIVNINNHSFTLSIPLPPKLSNIKERALSNLELLMPVDKRQTTIKDECRLIRSFVRHQYTPYDYLWQTNKMPYEEAKTLCNELVRSVYPELFE